MIAFGDAALDLEAEWDRRPLFAKGQERTPPAAS